jgi:hypothetical protein
MLTVGVIRELNFMSELTSLPLKADLCLSDVLCLTVNISNKILTVHHEGELIWEESLDDEFGNFGIESCHRIAQILQAKHSKSDYKHLIYREKS